MNRRDLLKGTGALAVSALLPPVSEAAVLRPDRAQVCHVRGFVVGDVVRDLSTGEKYIVTGVSSGAADLQKKI